MNSFRTQFIYPIFLLFLIFSAFWGLIICYLMYVGFNNLIQQNIIKDFFTLAGILIFFGYFFLITGHMTLLLRYGLNRQNGQTYLIDHLLFKKENISNICKGYSKSQFGKLQSKYNTVIIYLADGRKINLPKFLYLNFNDIEKELNIADIKFLGKEEFEWKNLIQRKYQYD